MKKLITILFLAIILTNCSFTQQGKGESGIKTYLKTTLNDYKSYEPVIFTVMIDGNTPFEMSEEYKYLESNKQTSLEEAERWNKDANESPFPENVPKFLKHSLEATQKADGIQYEIDKKKYKYKGDKCFEMQHTFRSKNKMGGTILKTVKFYLSKDYKVLCSIPDVF